MRAPLLEITKYTEFPAIQESVPQEQFAILIHLKAPHVPAWVSTRAPLDLVTVLDVSGSMSGPKLALLKRAMRFVIENLDPSDRLSVVAFSSSACRLFVIPEDDRLRTATVAAGCRLPNRRWWHQHCRGAAESCQGGRGLASQEPCV
jgi:hypothetical protein